VLTGVVCAKTMDCQDHGSRRHYARVKISPASQNTAVGDALTLTLSTFTIHLPGSDIAVTGGINTK